MSIDDFHKVGAGTKVLEDDEDGTPAARDTVIQRLPATDRSEREQHWGEPGFGRADPSERGAAFPGMCAGESQQIADMLDSSFDSQDVLRSFVSTTSLRPFGDGAGRKDSTYSGVVFYGGRPETADSMCDDSRGTIMTRGTAIERGTIMERAPATSDDEVIRMGSGGEEGPFDLADLTGDAVRLDFDPSHLLQEQDAIAMKEAAGVDWDQPIEVSPMKPIPQHTGL